MTQHACRAIDAPTGQDRPLVLICDDDPTIRYVVADQLQHAGYDTLEAEDGDVCLDQVRRFAPSVVVLDLGLPRKPGLTVLQELREEGNEVPVLVFSARSDVDSVVVATRLGASAFLQKPLEPREVGLQVEHVLAEDRLKREVHVLRDQARAGYGEFIGRSDALGPLFADLRRLEDVEAPTVLVLGESGTGKDVLARTLHQRGPRKDRMFVEVDCTSLSEHLVESELFGHEKGAFTDAKTSKRGLFEAASGGVVFLDEIGELALPMQAKLLRALENRTFKRVGGLASLKLDATVVAATNRDLKAEVAAGRFREDLYYRLNVVTLRLPALRERRDDIPLLVRHFLRRFNNAFGRHRAGTAIEGRQRRDVDADGLRVARQRAQLKNMLERIAILAPAGRIGLEQLPPEIRFARATRPSVPPRADGPPHFELPESGIVLDDVERDFVVQALARTKGNRTAAARLLGISRFQLRTRIERYALEDRS
ncbi:MAG: sigma-54 dependent transcriptional regulator [Myxococcota bacterium]